MVSIQASHDPIPEPKLKCFVGSTYFVLVISIMLISMIVTSDSLLTRLLTTINIMDIVFVFAEVSTSAGFQITCMVIVFQLNMV